MCVNDVSEPGEHRTRVAFQRGYNEWRAECSCGWVGSYFRLKDASEAEARTHVTDPTGERFWRR